MNVYLYKSVNYNDMQWPCDSWFHVPSYDEWNWLKTIMDWLGLTTGDNRRINLHMPFAGNRLYSDASINNQGTYGYYWSSSPYTKFPERASIIFIHSASLLVDAGIRTFGYPVRCFKNSFELPTSSWTVINGTLWWAWIFWDTVNWLISITGDGATWYTIQDKNLWATTVYNNWDILTQANMWNMYQWWNNYWFPSTWSVTTSSTQVNAQNYWPWNYYSSSTFITRSSSPYDWSSVQNDNLRWWVSWLWWESELKNAYIGEYVPQYLCFTANTASSTIQLTKTGSPTAVTLETSTNWTTWTTYTFWATITLANIWDKVYWRNTSTTDTGFSTNWANYYKFVMTWSIAASWDVNYLLNKNSTTTISSSYCYYQLFRDCTSLTIAPELPATTLAEGCYYNIFRGCTWLTTAPSALPATTLTIYCYHYMFYECTSLTTAPTLPATTLATYCYTSMFYWCTSLTTAPSLPSTTLADFCYYNMFYWCNKLTSVPSLPATTLSSGCYMQMFQWCSKIKISTTQTWEYQTAYRIPKTWTWTTASDALNDMFTYTWWTFTWAPSINTTYYTSNTVV